MRKRLLISLSVMLPTTAIACGGNSASSYIDHALLAVMAVAAFGAVSLPSCILVLHRLISLKLGIAIVAAVTAACSVSSYILLKSHGGPGVAWALLAIGLSLLLPYVFLLVKTVAYSRQQSFNK